MKTIEIKNLKKSYGHLEALSGISCLFEAGKKYSIIGPEGSGKTTLLNIIAGLEGFEGSVKIDGYGRVDVQNKDACISYVLDKPLFFENKSVLKNLEYQYKICGIPYQKTELISLIENHNLNPFERVKKLTYIEKLVLSFIRIEVKKSEIVLIDLDDFVEDLNLKSDVFLEMFSWIENYAGTVIIAENGANFVSNIKSDVLFLNFGVLKSGIDLKKELENPSNLFLYKSALKAKGLEESQVNIKVEKTMCGLSIVSSGLGKDEMNILKSLLTKKLDFNIGDKIEIVKLGKYFFEKLGGKIIS